MNLPLKITDSVYVGGEWVKATGEAEAVINPATEAVIGYAPVGGKTEVSEAIAAARQAFDRGPWPRMSAAERGAQLMELHAALMARRADSGARLQGSRRFWRSTSSLTCRPP